MQRPRGRNAGAAWRPWLQSQGREERRVGRALGGQKCGHLECWTLQTSEQQGPQIPRWGEVEERDRYDAENGNDD